MTDAPAAGDTPETPIPDPARHPLLRRSVSDEAGDPIGLDLACDVTRRLVPWLVLLLMILVGPRFRLRPPRVTPAGEYARWAFLLYEWVVLLSFRRAFLRAADGPAGQTAAEAGRL